VRVKVIVWLRVPEVAETVTVDVPAGVVVEVGVDGVEGVAAVFAPEPPHPDNNCTATMDTRTIPIMRSHAALRFRLIKLGQKSKARRLPEPAAASFPKRPDRMCGANEAAVDATPVVTVRVVLAAAPAGVTLAGLKLQVEFAGSPEHAKVVAALKAFTGITLTMVVVDDAAPTVSALDESVSVKLGAGGVTVLMVSVWAVEVLGS
jgi:hypothetical protein